ncbi:MAG: type II toxin-antitoxin system VapC family toxin [Candidatus Wallbacteria bacterium]|nr:type II toxin-antitoxin system VapC family toxin [Candidatus Wallbacteria bacterium]
MKKMRIYLDTSVINFLFAEDAPEFMAITRELFENFVGPGKYEVFISEVVIRELGKTRNETRKISLLKVISDYALKVLPLDSESEKLSEIYLEQGVIPKAKTDDARHVAIAATNQMDILLSWNFRHLANVNKQIKIKAINEKEGLLHPLLLLSPLEVIDEEEK